MAEKQNEAPQPTAPGRGLLERIDWSVVGAIVALATFSYAATILYRNLEDISWPQVRHTIATFPISHLLLAVFFTILSYAALVGYDFIALRVVGAGRVPLRITAITSFISHAVTFTFGFGVLTGGAVRLRLYRVWGVDTDRILGIVMLCALSFWTGLATIAGICLALDPQLVATLVHLSVPVCRLAGTGILAVIVVWLIYVAIRPIRIEVGNWRLPLPGTGATIAAIIVGMLDVAAAASALWVLLPPDLHITMPGFFVVFALATVLGVVSHVPGGLGVFDAVILLGIAPHPNGELVGSLLLFRLIYYIAPVVVALTMLLVHEMRSRKLSAHEDDSTSATIIEPIIPPLAAIATFSGGLILVISGTLPAHRLWLIRDFLPLPFVEASHFIASLVGTVLLLIANGLAHRLRSAWQLAIILLLSGSVFSITKGFDFIEALACLAAAVILYAGRREFYRKGGVLAGSLSASAVLAVLIAIGASILIGLAIYRGVPYDNSLWWEFAYHQDASRFLRATLGASIIVMIIAAYQILHRAPNIVHKASAAELQHAFEIAQTSSQVTAELAFTGDKRFLFSQSGDGFVMFGVRGATWVAMGDPIAEKSTDLIDLVWQFKESADAQRGTPVFYQVTADHLPIYLDAGFSLIKLGEEAWVDLEAFTLDGKAGKRLRQTKTRAERANIEFEILPATLVPRFYQPLKRVSDAWLAQRGHREKGFSLGFYNREYLKRHDVAVLRHDNRIVAFANFWRNSVASAWTLDLMRQVPQSPEGAMEYLVLKLLEQAKSEGYRWLNLGMAPLSGLPDHRLASRWARVAGLFFRYGDRLYNFEGVRIFKSKFKPEWRTKYLAYEHGLRLPQTLFDIASLISASARRSSSNGHHE
ncbi:MAG: bifunctional lysylphosphatidylglycerol flippase/synthetase MprF [Hyphomicrobium sp.]|uniref:bifunctional lysylphosphatidylglycerol flippase/synthetase MprF n=1 Tax=Hyphomicrobium sp. TaxID=82 RepID=UPI0039E2EFE6